LGKHYLHRIKQGGGDGSLAFIVGIAENITEQKRIELELWI